MPLVPLEILERTDLVIELGCGGSKRKSDAIGVDLLRAPGVDIVGDALVVLRELPDQCAREIYSSHFLEHIDDVRELLIQASRVLDTQGRFVAVVPHFSNPYFYSDPTHRSFFGLYTLSYYADVSIFRRTVPRYADPAPLRLIDARYRFRAEPPFYFRYLVSRLLGGWVNWSRWTQEFYEAHLCWIMPCYELEFTLVSERRVMEPG